MAAIGVKAKWGGRLLKLLFRKSKRLRSHRWQAFPLGHSRDASRSTS
jgi:hypothetical protein